MEYERTKIVNTHVHTLLSTVSIPLTNTTNPRRRAIERLK